MPDAPTLAVIAKKCEVSADFLVGLSENSSIETAGMDTFLGLSKVAIEFLRAKPENAAVFNRLISSDEADRFVELSIGYNEKTAIEVALKTNSGTHWLEHFLLNSSHPELFSYYMGECLRHVYAARNDLDVLIDISKYKGKKPIIQKAIHELSNEDQDILRSFLNRTGDSNHAK